MPLWINKFFFDVKNDFSFYTDFKNELYKNLNTEVNITNILKFTVCNLRILKTLRNAIGHNDLIIFISYLDEDIKTSFENNLSSKNTPIKLTALNYKNSFENNNVYVWKNNIAKYPPLHAWINEMSVIKNHDDIIELNLYKKLKNNDFHDIVRNNLDVIKLSKEINTNCEKNKKTFYKEWIDEKRITFFISNFFNTTYVYILCLKQYLYVLSNNNSKLILYIYIEIMNSINKLITDLSAKLTEPDLIILKNNFIKMFFAKKYYLVNFINYIECNSINEQNKIKELIRKMSIYKNLDIINNKELSNDLITIKIKEQIQIFKNFFEIN